MDQLSRLQLYLSYFISVTLVIAIFTSAFFGQWLNSFLSAFSLIVSFVPAFLRRSYKVYLPIEFDFLLALFLYLSIYLGTVHDYYTYFWWWDTFLHALSGVLMGLIGFILIYILVHERRPRLELSPFLVFVFTFSFSLMIGALWEIFEFWMDQFFDLDMQMNSVVDTMFDLMADTLGGLLIGVGGYFYVKKVRVPLFDRFLEILHQNPGFFRTSRAYRSMKKVHDGMKKTLQKRSKV